MIGRSIGRYRITAKLGEGGMGSVWKAEDPVLERSIALKFLPEGLASSPDGRRRFLREARAASQLHHPGIATVFDTGEHEGLYYIALLHIEGETLSDRIARGPLAVHEAARIALEVAEALGYAHLHGVLHRDITARNIMVKHEDGRAILVDFGLALPQKHSRLTQTGSAMGTVAYLSPEVAQGGEADRRSDLYGLGVVLYEMLTGRLPFAGERAEAVLYATVHEPPAPPSRSNADVPPALDRIVLRALEKERARRYQTAEELAADLREFLGLGAPGTPPGVDQSKTVPIERSVGARRWPLGTRTTIILRRSLGAGVLALIAALVLWRFGIFAPKRFERVAVLPLGSTSADSSDAEYLADGISEALITKLTETHLQVIPWMTASRYRDASRPLLEVARELNVDALIVGTLRASGGRIHVAISLVNAKTGLQDWAHEIDEPRADLMVVQGRIALSAASQLKGRLSIQEKRVLEATPSHNPDAYEHFLRGQAAAANGDLQSNVEALAFFERALQLDPDLAEAQVGAGAMLTQRYWNGWQGGARNLGEAERHFQNALRIDPRSASARRGLILFYFYQGKEEDVLKQGQEVEKLHLEDVEHLLARAEAYIYGTLGDQAVPLCLRILQLDPANQPAQFDLALSYISTGEYQKSIEAGNVFLVKFGDDPEALMFIGWAYHCLGDLERARASYARSYGILPELVTPMLQSAMAFSQSGQPDSASSEVRRAIEILTGELTLYPENPARRAVLASAYAMLGTRELAIQEEVRLLRDVGDNGFVNAVLGGAHAALGEYPRAFELWRRAMQLGCRYQIFILPCPEGLGLRDAPGFADFMKDYEREGDRRRALYAPAGVPP